MAYAGLYGQEQDLFDREYLTENEFRALFVHDDDALNRMGVRSVEEVPRLICASPCVLTSPSPSSLLPSDTILPSGPQRFDGISPT